MPSTTAKARPAATIWAAKLAIFAPAATRPAYSLSLGAAGLKTVAVTHTYDRHALSADLVVEGLDSLEIGSLRSICSV